MRTSHTDTASSSRSLYHCLTSVARVKLSGQSRNLSHPINRTHIPCSIYYTPQASIVLIENAKFAVWSTNHLPIPINLLGYRDMSIGTYIRYHLEPRLLMWLFIIQIQHLYIYSGYRYRHLWSIRHFGFQANFWGSTPLGPNKERLDRVTFFGSRLGIILSNILFLSSHIFTGTNAIRVSGISRTHSLNYFHLPKHFVKAISSTVWSLYLSLGTLRTPALIHARFSSGSITSYWTLGLPTCSRSPLYVLAPP